MKRVGEVSRVAQGLAIVRLPGEEHPNIGTAVIDENLDEVGRIVDVFGPVSNPYVAISSDRRPATLIGVKLYAR
ncbi:MULTISPECIES: H/ACA ribonucleoprotein complex subunit GAR1 [unclassified Haladaptatus]|uniref:H/ACA ribonucleoprotein complex subunit GAR1 n=1 Tax=unclassified Haladaptatus TaxID=2622732 RepID=UPI002FCE458B